MSYFNTQQIPLAGRADIFKGGGTDFQSLLDASSFDLGTAIASNSDLTQTTAAPADGPSGALTAAGSAEQPKNSLGLGFDLTNDQQFQLALLDRLKGERPTAADDERKFRMIQTLQEEAANRANKMGRQNALLGFALKDLPKYMAAPARAAATYDNLNAQAPYFGAQNSKRYFS
jgi:hypothetical protein